LLESIDPEGLIGSFIEKRGEGIHHIAFAVDNTDKALNNAKANEFRLIDRVSRKVAEGMNIGFLNPRSTNDILIEFCSK
jgi:methylmalonyl-CoA/ethylmalonyl-CoA epimerase